MPMTNPTFSSIDSIKYELLSRCDGPVTPFVVIARATRLDSTVDRSMLANAIYEALNEIGCKLDTVDGLSSNEY